MTRELYANKARYAVFPRSVLAIAAHGYFNYNSGSPASWERGSMLTEQQRNALYVVLFLLLLGLAVKAWRTAHPSTAEVPAPAKENASR